MTNLRSSDVAVEERAIGSPGLEGPEFFSGTGILARDTSPGRVDVTLGENGRVTLNFANAEIRDVIDIVLGDTLNLSYIIDPAVAGTVTVRTSQPLSRDAVIPAMESILALNGVAMTLVDGTYMIVPQELAAKGLSTPLVSPTEQQLARGFGINIVPLNYVSASTMQALLEPFVIPGSLRADDTRNLLIFSGKGRDAVDLLEMVEVFDVDWMRGMSFALLPVDVADVKELVTELEIVFLQDGKSPLAGMIRFAPIERLNAVLVISSQPAYLNQAETWVSRLDRGAEGAGRRIFVYYVENGRAEDIAVILNDVFATGRSERGAAARRGEVAPELTPVELEGTESGVERTRRGGTPAPAEGAIPGEAQPLSPRQPRPVAGAARPRGQSEAVGGLIQESGDIRVIADDTTNSLVILATASEYRMIEATLRKLDILPLQVLIEATILEVTLNDVLRYGVQWFLEEGDIATQFVTATAEAFAAPLGFSFLFDSNNVRALVNALDQVTNTKVISSPQLMVLDNQSARIQVGDQVPFETGTSLGEGGVSTSEIQQIDTGVVLEVNPRINPGGLVVLEVSQEVSEAQPTEGESLNPTIRQRQIQSKVAVQSGETLALGGLIRDSNTESVSGIPLLMDIPILGNLFKTTTDTTVRTELLVLITPKVVRNQGDARAITEELRQRLKTIEPLERKVFGPQKTES